MDINWDRDFALDQADGDEDLLKELLAIFTGTLADGRQKIKEGLATDDFLQVARAAHSLKGSASSLGFAETAEMANTLEKQAREGDASQGSEFLVMLESLAATLPGLT